MSPRSKGHPARRPALLQLRRSGGAAIVDAAFLANIIPDATRRSRCDAGAEPGAFPASPAQLALDDWRLDPHRDENGFRDAAIEHLAEHHAAIDLKAKLRADAETQPIEDASIEWPARDGECRTIATSRLPREAAYRQDRVRYFDEISA